MRESPDLARWVNDFPEEVTFSGEIKEQDLPKIPPASRPLLTRLESQGIFLSFMETPSKKPSQGQRSPGPGATDETAAKDSSGVSLPDQARAGLALIKEMRAKGLLSQKK